MSSKVESDRTSSRQESFRPEIELSGSDSSSSSPPDSPMSTSSDQSGIYWDPFVSSSSTDYSRPQFNQLKRSNSDSDMKVANLNSKQPRFATKYDEMLQPLSPVTTLPVETKQAISIHKTHKSSFDAKLQRQFHNLMGFASNVNDIEDFLTKHSENVDLNEYNEEGRTALQQSCFEGNLQLAQVLVRFGADSRLTTREGFSALHIAAFSGHSDVLLYIMSLKHRWYFAQRDLPRLTKCWCSILWTILLLIVVVVVVVVARHNINPPTQTLSSFRPFCWDCETEEFLL